MSESQSKMRDQEPQELNGAIDSYKISLLVRHPDIDPAEISKGLNLLPYVAFKVGTTRILPNGHALPGLASDSRWSHVYWFSKESKLGNSLETIVSFLEVHKAFLRRLSLKGALLDLYVQLPGDVNISGAWSWQLLNRIAQLRLALGVEVFPKPNPSSWLQGRP